MRDEELLDVMKRTLSDARMDRPVEAIEQRGRAVRRNRGLLGVVASGGLAAVAALALALPMAFHRSGPAPAESGPVAGGTDGGGTDGGGTDGGAPAMEQAAFTVAKQMDGSVKLTLNYKVLLKPEALEKALADAGIPAVVKADVHCVPKGKELPEYKEVFPFVAPDNPAAAYPNGLVIAIAQAKMPKNSVVYFSIYTEKNSKGYPTVDKYLVSKDAPMSCRPV